MAERDEPESPVRLERFVQIEREIAWDPEDVADASLPQGVEEKCAEFHMRNGPVRILTPEFA
jgi:hypothetical protein